MKCIDMTDLPHGRLLDLELLRTFETVVQLNSFTAAATRLHCTQSTISAQVRRLEEITGCPLMTRNNKGIALTPVGETLLGEARRLLRLNNEAMAALGAHELRGKVRLGVPADYTTAFLSRVLPAFGHAYPNVELEVHCDMSHSQLIELEAGRLDLAIGTLGPNGKNGEVIAAEPLVWAGATDGQAWEKDPLPLAVFPPSCRFREIALEQLSKSGRRSRIAYTSPSMAGIEVAVTSDFAVAPVSRGSMRPGMRELGEDEDLPALTTVEVALYRGMGLSEPAERLAAFIKKQAESLDYPAINE